MDSRKEGLLETDMLGIDFNNDIFVCFTHSHLVVDVYLESMKGYLVKAKGTYDTGSQISLLKTDIVDSYPAAGWIGEIEPYKHVVRGASGEPISVRGELTMDCIIAGRKVKQDFVVADISEDVLLGLDFMVKYEAGWDWKSNSLKYQDWVGPKVQCCTLDKTIRTPAKQVACCRVAVGDISLDGTLLCTNNIQLTEGVVVHGGVASVSNGEVPLWIENTTSKDYAVGADELYCEAEVVEEKNVELATQQDHMDGDVGMDVNMVTTEQPRLADELQTLVDEVDASLGSEVKEAMADLLHSYRDVFALKGDPLGRTGVVKHEIDTADAAPIRQAPRRIPLHQVDMVEEAMEDMKGSGVIRPSESPWASPVVIVRKKDGGCRFCIDYRRLNDVTIKDAYPLPRVEDSLDSLAGSAYFSTLDLKSGYWQVEMDEQSKAKTAFASKYGLWEWNVMPFGLTNAPATFQRLMERVLVGLQWKICALYLDDVIVMASTPMENIKRLGQVFERLRAAGLKLKAKKCTLLQQNVKFLGHVVNKDGVHTDPEKVIKIVEWRTPVDTTGVRAFIGLASYYR